MKKQILIFLIGVLGFGACNSSKPETGSNASASNEVTTLQAQAFQQKIEQTPDAQVLDVRSAEECKSGMIPKAQQIEYGSENFEAKVKNLDKKKPVFVYCLAGVRSARAAGKLRELGFEQIFNLEDGLKSWESKGFPMSMNP